MSFQTSYVFIFMQLGIKKAACMLARESPTVHNCRKYGQVFYTILFWKCKPFSDKLCIFVHISCILYFDVILM